MTIDNEMETELPQADDGFVDVTGDLFRFEDFGDQITGRFVSVSPIVHADGKGNFNYTVADEKTGELSVLVGTTALNRSMQNVAVGDVIRVTFTGEVPTGVAGRNPVKQFSVQKRLKV